MNKILLISVFLVIVIMTATLTGCVETDVNKIEGTIHNNTDERAYIDFRNKATGETWYWGVGANRTVNQKLSPGVYSLTAKFYTNDEYIDSEELTIQKLDSTFTIIISNTSLYAEAY